MIGLMKKGESKGRSAFMIETLLKDLGTAIKKENLPFIDSGSVSLGNAVVINYRSTLPHLEMFVEGIVRRPPDSSRWQITVRILQKIDDQLVMTASVGPAKCPTNEVAVLTALSRIKDSMKRVAEDIYLLV
jgi:hypothetical protein